MHAKQELEAYSNQQEYSTYISEAQEYSHEKSGECLSPTQECYYPIYSNTTKQK